MRTDLDLEERNILRQTLLMQACLDGDFDAVGLLLDYVCVCKRDYKGRTVLHLAAKLDRIDIVQLILEKNSSKKFLFTKDIEGKTAAYYAIFNSPTLEWIRDHEEFAQ